MTAYVVIYEQAEDGGWGAFLPDLPGVVALGRSRSEVAERIQEALTAYSEEPRLRGEPLPAPHHEAGGQRKAVASSQRRSTPDTPRSSRRRQVWVTGCPELGGTAPAHPLDMHCGSPQSKVRAA